MRKAAPTLRQATRGSQTTLESRLITHIKSSRTQRKLKSRSSIRNPRRRDSKAQSPTSNADVEKSDTTPKKDGADFDVVGYAERLPLRLSLGQAQA